MPWAAAAAERPHTSLAGVSPSLGLDDFEDVRLFLAENKPLSPARWETFVAYVRGTVQRLLTRAGSSRQYDALSVEDLVQDVLAVLVKQAPSCGCATFNYYVYGVARNLVLRFLKDAGRPVDLCGLPGQPADPEAGYGPLDTVPETNAAYIPHEWYLVKEECWALEEAAESLSAACREAVELRYGRGMSVVEVAVTLGLSPAAARKRLDRAEKRLREILKDLGMF